MQYNTNTFIQEIIKNKIGSAAFDKMSNVYYYAPKYRLYMYDDKGIYWQGIW